MKIEIPGRGCAKYRKFEDLVHEVVKQERVEAEIAKEKGTKKIIAYGMMTTPDLVIADR